MSPKRALDTDKLYTSAQVRAMLGISPSTLTDLVDKGVIEKIIPVGYKNGYYTKASVDEYHKQQSMFLQTYTSKKERTLEVRKAKEEEQGAIYEMEKEVLGVTIPLETRLAWYRKNPDIDFVAIANGEVLGHLSLLPLPEHVLWAKMRREVAGQDLTADDIEAYTPGNVYNLFVMAMAVRPEATHAGRIYAGLLFREAQQSLYEMAYQGKLVHAIYASSRTRDGIYMCERMHFTPMPEYHGPHFKSFVLDMSTNTSSWAREYREYIASLDIPDELKRRFLEPEQDNQIPTLEESRANLDSKTSELSPTTDASEQNGAKRRTPSHPKKAPTSH